MDTTTQISVAKDRSHVFPPHTGPNVLPNSPFFTKLLRHAYRGRTALKDHRLGVTKTYVDILSDALTVRSKLERMLSSDVLQGLAAGREIYIGVLAPGGYEFAVAMIAGLAIGAAVVPMSVANPPDEIVYFVEKAQQVAILSSSNVSDLSRSVIDRLQNQVNTRSICHIDILSSLGDTRFEPSDIVISSNRYLDDNAAGVVIFTSGTTGRPKGAVLRRAYIHESALHVADGYEIQASDVLLHTLPVHHATGLGTSFFPWMASGACIEFRTHGGFDPAWVWNRFREGGITVFSGVPTIYLRLMWYFQNDIASLPSKDQEEYVAGARKLKSLLCGSSALQQPVQDFWTQLRDGRPILVRYGSSEIPGCIRVAANADFESLPIGCVGSPAPGVDVKIEEDGELLLKSPLMFSKYLRDEEATLAAHDKDGWYKTGDICRREGKYIFIVGRASVDIIKSGGYKIGAIEIEKACLDLPYVREACVVGVEDQEYGQRVAAILSLTQIHRRPGSKSENTRLSIDDLRNDLRKVLPSYKLPTLLRVIDRELPKGQTGKVQKKKLGPDLFPVPGWDHEAGVQVWNPRQKRPGARL